MMRRRSLPLLMTTLLALTAALAQEPPGPPPPQPPPGGGTEATERRGGQIGEAVRKPDDPRIPLPGDLGPGTDPRLFVESFIVSLADRTPKRVYETYLNDEFRGRFSEQQFIDSVLDLRRAAGPLQRLAVRYLREENGRYEGRDGGHADYVLVFERDPRVDIRVEFRRDGDGLWRVLDYSLQSPLLDRLAQARAEAARGTAPPSEAAEGRPPSSPPEP